MGIGFVWRQVTTHNATFDPTMDEPRCPAGGPEPCRTDAGSQLRAAFVGSIPGLAIGLTSGSLLARKAPTYGRVTLIQSAALGGMVAGALMQVALQWKPYGLSWEFTSEPRDRQRQQDAADGATGDGDQRWRRSVHVRSEGHRPGRLRLSPVEHLRSRAGRAHRSQRRPRGGPPRLLPARSVQVRSDVEARAADRSRGRRRRAGGRCRGVRRALRHLSQSPSA